MWRKIAMGFLAGALFVVPGCSDGDVEVDEAIEEVGDEIDDAVDNVKDEVDDITD